MLFTSAFLKERTAVRYTRRMRWSSALQSGRQSASVGGTAKTKTKKGRCPRVVAIVVGLLLLGFALGLHPVVEYHDLTCPPGTVARYVSVAYWAVQCEPSEGSSQATTVPTSRYIGLFLTNVNIRVFDMDFLADNFHGPGMNVSS